MPFDIPTDARLLYSAAWERWGKNLQFIMVMEECAELIKRCSKECVRYPPVEWILDIPPEALYLA